MLFRETFFVAAAPADVERLRILLAAIRARPRRSVGLAIDRRDRVDDDSSRGVVVAVVADPNLGGRPKLRYRRSAGMLVLDRRRDILMQQGVTDEHRFAELVRAEYLPHRPYLSR